MNIKYNFFVGTYTQNTLSKGIYGFNLNSDGKILGLSEIYHSDNPSFLCLSKENNVLYAASENADYAAVTAYVIKGKELEILAKSKFAGSSLCYISATDLHNNILGACYRSGDVFSILLDNKNSILSHYAYNLVDKTSHVHYISSDKSGSFAIAVDFGLDCIYIYQIKDGVLIPNKLFSKIVLKNGEGPRHFAFHPFLDIAYVVTELSNNVLTFQFNSNTGELKKIDSKSCLPNDFNGKSFASELVISSNGKYLYVSNRGANTITLFEILECGNLHKIGYFSCFGDWPRHIHLTYDNRFMIISNQKSDEIVIVPIDLESGEVFNPIETIKIPSPTCVCEVYKNEKSIS